MIEWTILLYVKREPNQGGISYLHVE